MKYFIGADLGTSALKLLLLNENKKIINSVTRGYEIIYPKNGWTEQKPDDWWEAFINGVTELIKDIDSKSVCGIGVAGQMHGLVILDENDNVIRPAILWNDGRCSKETDYLNEVIGKKSLSELTANIAFSGFTAPKILWLKNNEPESYNRISKIMLPKDYINYRLTGSFATDYSDASGTLLLDVKNKCWSEKMLEVCGVDVSVMPKLFNSFEKIGIVKSEVACEFGFGDNVYVCAGAGDNAGAAIGTGTIGNERCNISLGTSGTVFISTEQFRVDENNALHSFCHSDGGYHLMGCMLSCALCNKWFCDEILNTNNYLAEQSNIKEEMLGKNSVFFLPYLMGERSPLNDTDATGVFIGLQANTKREEMLLAVLEGVAFAIRDIFEVAKKLGIHIKESTVCGGGAKSELWLKIMANVLNIELCLPESEQGPAMGAVLLAMSKDGFLDIACQKPKIKGTIKPTADLVELYNKKYNKFKRIYPSIKELYKEIKEDI